MEELKRWLRGAALVAGAFAAGWWLGGGRSVHAQASVPQVDVRQVGPGNSLLVFYPEQQMVYVYTQPFVGLPDSYCSYRFKLTTPGGKITREQCGD